MQIRPVGQQLLNADRGTDGRMGSRLTS